MWMERQIRPGAELDNGAAVVKSAMAKRREPQYSNFLSNGSQKRKQCQIHH